MSDKGRISAVTIRGNGEVAREFISESGVQVVVEKDAVPWATAVAVPLVDLSNELFDSEQRWERRLHPFRAWRQRRNK